MYKDSPISLLIISGGGGGGGGRSDINVFVEIEAMRSRFSSAWKSSKVFRIFFPSAGLISLCAGDVAEGFSTYFLPTKLRLTCKLKCYLSMLLNVFGALDAEEPSRDGIC